MFFLISLVFYSLLFTRAVVVVYLVFAIFKIEDSGDGDSVVRDRIDVLEEAKQKL